MEGGSLELELTFPRLFRPGQSEFAASYLPQFVRSYCMRSFDEDPSIDNDLIRFTHWMAQLVNNARRLSFTSFKLPRL